MAKSRAFVPALLGLVLMGALALALASQALGRGAAPGAGETPQGQGYPPPATRAPVEAQGYPPPVSPTVDTFTPGPVFIDESLLPPTITAVPALPESFDPKTYGLPEVIAGYPVLAVLTSDNKACMPAGQKSILLQSPYPNVEDYFSNQESGDAPDVGRALEELGLSLTEWSWSIAGPGTTREQVIQHNQEWNKVVQQAGCGQRLGPIPTEVVTATP